MSLVAMASDSNNSNIDKQNASEISGQLESSPRSKPVSLPSITALTAPISKSSASLYIPFNYPNLDTKRKSITSTSQEGRRTSEASSESLSRTPSSNETSNPAFHPTSLPSISNPSNILPPLHALVSPISPLVAATGASSPTSLQSDSSYIKRDSYGSISSFSSLSRLPSLTGTDSKIIQGARGSTSDYFSSVTATRPRLGSLPDFLSSDKHMSISKELLRKTSNENLHDVSAVSKGSTTTSSSNTQLVYDPVLGKRTISSSILAKARLPSPNTSINTTTEQRNGSATPIQEFSSAHSSLSPPSATENCCETEDADHAHGETATNNGDEKKTRIVRRRTRTGCLTCRKRRIKCDERKPFCHNCEKSKKVCAGYEQVPYGARRYRYMAQPTGGGIPPEIQQQLNQLQHQQFQQHQHQQQHQQQHQHQQPPQVHHQPQPQQIQQPQAQQPPTQQQYPLMVHPGGPEAMNFVSPPPAQMNPGHDGNPLSPSQYGVQVMAGIPPQHPHMMNGDASANASSPGAPVLLQYNQPQNQQPGGVYILSPPPNGAAPPNVPAEQGSFSRPVQAQPGPAPPAQLQYQPQMIASGGPQPYMIGGPNPQQVIGVYYTSAAPVHQQPYPFDPHQQFQIQHLPIQGHPTR